LPADRRAMSLFRVSMETARLAGRSLKKRVLELLHSEEGDGALETLCRLPPRQVINPLFSFFNSPDQDVKWSAVNAAGAVVARLAEEDMEGARVIMRRLMWYLNDESGGIGWGCPEAMGEIMARHGALAEEYVQILTSYTREEQNYLEHEMLQRGLLWGIGRLSRVRPGLVKLAPPRLVPYLASGDGSVRGHAAWVSGILEFVEARPALEPLAKDEAEFEIYIDRSLTTWRVKDAATEALRKLTPQAVDFHE
jgi:HEAT repeat protein